ncbi:hypothetical protein F5Y15DRAFT_76011 [Xylariaceae sp. FL0016]|nr:hypothetical protein F5Y15DRAFT_76011 [Xylariaceae sp. FL0016]
MPSYPYAPPPPAPSAAPPNSYPPYGKSQGYHHGSSRGSHSGASRGRGHHQGSGRNEHSSQYYQPSEYSSPGNTPYTPPQGNAYWQSPSHMPASQQSAAPLPPSNYHPNYAPQAYAPPQSQGYQSRPSYGSPYTQQQPYDYSAHQWSEQSHPYPTQYGNRGGRGAYQSDRGGHKADHPMGPPMRMGFDHRNDHPVSNSHGYAQAYSPATHPQPPAYPQPQFNYPPAPPLPYAAPNTSYNNSSRGGGHGRDGSRSNHRGGRGGFSDRGGKSHHRDQRPNHSQKSDAASSKKKKRKTNTLGLTPGEAESDDAGVDEETRLKELLGDDAPTIPDLKVWLAERRGNYPTKAHVQHKKAAGVLPKGEQPTADIGPVTELDKTQAEADKLRKQLAKVERKLEKRKRAANDEGDEMRGSVSESSDSSDDEPDVEGTGKPKDSFLPPAPRADPSQHCKYYSTGGTCGKKGKCRFKHDSAVRRAALDEQIQNGGRFTLRQRLMLNDRNNEEMEVVKAVVEMRVNGRLHDPKNPEIRQKRQEREQAALASVSKPSLPTTAGVANLPPNPYASANKSPKSKSETKKPYQNMYLGGFSNPNKNLQPSQLP